MSMTALERAIAAAGSHRSFAAEVGTSQQRISYLVKNKKPLPAELVLKTEEVFGISRHELRPDIYPREEAA